MTKFEARLAARPDSFQTMSESAITSGTSDTTTVVALGQTRDRPQPELDACSSPYHQSTSVKTDSAMNQSSPELLVTVNRTVSKSAARSRDSSGSTSSPSEIAWASLNLNDGPPGRQLGTTEQSSPREDSSSASLISNENGTKQTPAKLAINRRSKRRTRSLIRAEPYPNPAAPRVIMRCSGQDSDSD